jgi:simple sugar transport system permease protein
LLAKIFDGKKEALVVQEIEAQPNDQDQEGGTI